MHKQLSLALVILLAGGLLWFGLQSRESASAAPRDGHAATAERASAKAEAPAALPAPKAAPDAAPSQNDSRWRNAAVLDRGEFATGSAGIMRRVSLLEVPDLPHPVRVEEHVRRGPDGREDILKREEMVADRIIVRFAEGVKAENFEAAFAEEGIRILKQISSIGLYEVSIPLSLDGVPAARDALARRPDIAHYAEPDYIVHAMVVPNDPRCADGSLWGLDNTGQSGGTVDIDIDAPEGWDIRTGADGIIVGVIDTGVRHTHEDLAANMWINPGESGLDEFGNDRAANGIDDDNNGAIDDVHGINAISEDPVKRGNPTDDHGHGSHTAGTVGAVGNNGLGVAGVAWNVRIMALKFLSASGSGALSDAIECMEYALANGARLLSNSWGGGPYNEALIDMLRLLRDNGVVFVAAAGNDGSSNDAVRVYPASYAVENVVAVAALDRTGALAGYSNFGYGTVQVAAPGNDILSAGIENDADYATMSGTSMACPHVTGIMALIASEYPDEDYTAHINRLLGSAAPLESLHGKVLTGGCANLFGALGASSPHPFNDDFADAAVLEGTEITLRSNNRHATTEADEPPHAGPDSGASVWWRWTAPAPGLAILNLDGSGFDTRAAVYTGDSLATLVLVAENDDFEGGAHSRLQWIAEEGVTYHVAVAGAPGAEGLVQLSLSGPPENDNLARAAVLADVPAIVISNSLNATAEPGEPSHAGQPAKRSLWWKWTAGSSGKVVFATEYTVFDAVIAVYTGPVDQPEMADLVLLAQNDDNNFGGTWAEVKFEAVPGETYYIAVDHKSGEESVAWLNTFRPEVNDDFADRFRLPGDAFNVTAMNILATFEAGEPDHDGNGSGYSLWWEWTPDSNGDFLITTDGSMMSTALGVYTGNRVDRLDGIASDSYSGPNASSQVVVRASAGQSYQIAVDKQLSGGYFGTIRLGIAPIVLPPNDAFADATEITEFPAVVTGFNTAATREPGEYENPNYSINNTVWWKWTAPRDLDVAVSTNGSSFDTVMGVFSGTSLGALTLVGFDDESGVNRASYLRFSAVAGTTYHFQVSGYFMAVGDIVLNLGEFERPANDNLRAAEALTGNFCQRMVVNIGASEEPGEPDHAPPVEGLNYDPGGTSIWYKWTPDPTQSGRTVASTFGTGFGTTVAVYEGPAENPSYAQLTLVTANTHRGDNNGWGQAAWNAVAGKIYYIVLDGDYGQTGQMAFSFWVGPEQDLFARRVLLTGSAVVTEGVANFGATKEPGEPKHAGNRGGKSLWWEWMPPEDGLYRIHTRGSRYNSSWGSHYLDTLLAVYTGTSVSALSPVASNDDISRTNLSSEVVFAASAGTAYKIAVDGNNNSEDAIFAAAGLVVLDIAPFAGPDNDDFADAMEVHGPEVGIAASLLGASRESGEPLHAGKARRSLWWRWTAPDSGEYFAANAGAIYLEQPSRKPGVAVYTGIAVEALTAVASGSNTEWKAAGIARARFTAEAGQTYHIAIDDSDEAMRHAVHLMINKAPANDNFADAAEIIGRSATVSSHNLGATEEADEPQIESWKDPAAHNTSVWWKWTAGASGTTHVDTLGSAIFSIMGVYTGDSLATLSQVAVNDSTGRAPDYHNIIEDKMRAGCAQLDFNAVAGTTYFFMVCGSYYDRSSQGRVVLSVEGPAGTPLAAPAKFSASATGTDAVTLSWQDKSNGEDGFAIERAHADGEFVQIAVTAAEATSFADASLEPGTLYRYRVRAIGYEASAWSSVLSVQTRFITHPSYAGWAAAHFTPEQLADPTLAGHAADPDTDLLPNKLEYLLMLDPWTDDSGANRYPLIELVEIDGLNYLSCHLSWSLDAADATPILQASSDLSIWENIPLDDPALHLFILDEPAVNPQRRTLTIRDVAPIGPGRVLRLIAD
ncbi:MAG: S8 family serine peptidase [Oceanipulchritudo sp.]